MNDVVDSGFNLNSLLNQTEEAATEICAQIKRPCRVWMREGKAQVSTRDVNPNRVNLVIVDGVVQSYTLG